MKIEVGQRWKMRNGRVAQIIRCEVPTKFPILAVDSKGIMTPLTREGRYYEGKDEVINGKVERTFKESEFDLMEIL